MNVFYFLFLLFDSTILVRYEIIVIKNIRIQKRPVINITVNLSKV